MRIFDPEVLVRSFQQLGFDEHLLAQWQGLTQHSHGIILVTELQVRVKQPHCIHR